MNRAGRSDSTALSNFSDRRRISIMSALERYDEIHDLIQPERSALAHVHAFTFPFPDSSSIDSLTRPAVLASFQASSTR